MFINVDTYCISMLILNVHVHYLIDTKYLKVEVVIISLLGRPAANLMDISRTSTRYRWLQP